MQVNLLTVPDLEITVLPFDNPSVAVVCVRVYLSFCARLLTKPDRIITVHGHGSDRFSFSSRVN